MKVNIKTYEEISRQELYDLLQLRSEIFVVEQDCVYQDIDGKDQNAFHVLGLKEGKLVAYTRVFKAGDYFEQASIGRVAVAKSQRKHGFGQKIMKASMAFIVQNLNEPTIVLSAQTYLIKFYSEMGFQAVGENYLEDGIPHIKMKYQPKS